MTRPWDRRSRVTNIHASALLRRLGIGVVGGLALAWAEIHPDPGSPPTDGDAPRLAPGEDLSEWLRADQTLRALIAVIPFGIAVADAHGRIVVANPAANNIFGGTITGNAFGPRGGYTLHHADGTPFATADLPLSKALMRGEATHDVEILVRHPDGAECIILSAGRPIQDAAGRSTGAVGIFQDITRRVQATGAFQKNEERLAEAQRIAHLGNWDWEIPTNQLWWSDEIYRIFGVRPRRFGATYDAFLGFVHPDDRALVEAHVRAALDEKLPYDIDHRVVRPDGSVRIVHEMAHVTFDQDGRPLRMVGTVQDVTAQRQVEQERLRFLQREQALAQIAQALVRESEFPRVVDVVLDQCLTVLGMDVVALWLADPISHTLVLCAHRHLSHETTEEIQRIPYDSPLLAARAACTEQMQVASDVSAVELPSSARQLYEREGLRSLLTVPLLAHGHLVGVLCSGTRLTYHFSPWDLDLNQTVAGLFGVAIENAHLYQEVRDTLRLREEFISAAAHELRTPLTVIKGRTKLALRTDAHEERARQALATVDHETDRIGRLAEDLLAVVRIRPGHTTLHRERCDLSDLIRTKVAQVAQTATDKEFRVVDADPLIVDADPPLIGVVLSRVLENAVRYSPERGRIEVAARRVDGEAVVSVTDHGVGIAVERQRHVFEPFYEPVPAGSTGYVGIVSLGLYLSKQIIDAHGGRIWVVSTPGQGATLAFSLPLSGEPVGPPVAPLSRD